MTTASLIVDAMKSGTGIRDGIDGGYITPADLKLSRNLTDKLSEWLSRYNHAFFHNYEDSALCTALDAEGIELAKQLAQEKPDHTVGYFSDATMERMDDLVHR